MNIDVSKLFQEMGRLHLHNMTLQEALAEAQAKLAELEKKLAPADIKSE